MNKDSYTGTAMGYSGGKDFKDLDGNEFHLETNDRGVAVWSKDELKRFLMLSKEDATTLGEELIYHARCIPDKDDQL